MSSIGAQHSLWPIGQEAKVMGAVIRMLLGILLLIFGRSLFWLFVAGIGFLVGASFAAQALPGQPEWVILVVALAVGIAGALLALVVPAAIGVVTGFVAGGYLVTTLFDVVGANAGSLAWLPFVMGGLLGAIIVLLLFDWAVIGLSSLAGALTIIDVLALHGMVAIVLALVLFFIGVAVQTGLWRSRPSRGGMTVSR